jgi:hypothetical protein
MGSQITVFRSADESAKEEAEGVRQMLLDAGIPAVLLDDTAPGLVVGTYEVRVEEENQTRAEELIAGMPADQEQDEPKEAGDPSHALDLVTVFSSGAGARAEMEALSIQSILDAGGISAVFAGDTRYPIFPVNVRVTRTDEAKARELIAEALASGPAGADEAEAEGEKE